MRRVELAKLGRLDEASGVRNSMSQTERARQPNLLGPDKTSLRFEHGGLARGHGRSTRG